MWTALVRSTRRACDSGAARLRLANVTSCGLPFPAPDGATPTDALGRVVLSPRRGVWLNVMWWLMWRQMGLIWQRTGLMFHMWGLMWQHGGPYANGLAGAAVAQAGSDSLITACNFFKLNKMYFGPNSHLGPIEKYKNVLYGAPAPRAPRGRRRLLYAPMQCFSPASSLLVTPQGEPINCGYVLSTGKAIQGRASGGRLGTDMKEWRLLIAGLGQDGREDHDGGSHDNGAV